MSRLQVGCRSSLALGAAKHSEVETHPLANSREARRVPVETENTKGKAATKSHAHKHWSRDACKIKQEPPNASRTQRRAEDTRTKIQAHGPPSSMLFLGVKIVNRPTRFPIENKLPYSTRLEGGKNTTNSSRARREDPPANPSLLPSSRAQDTTTVQPSNHAHADHQQTSSPCPAPRPRDSQQPLAANKKYFTATPIPLRPFTYPLDPPPSSV